jgi:ArsR family transcriptional regulator, arsenate/arsenite/antimonite-responsive transcriptional repressor
MYCQEAQLSLLITLGHNEGMPRITHPGDTAWSSDVEVAVSTFGNRARNEIIRFLVANGPAARGDIVNNVSAGEPAVAKHLLVLEESGVVRADVEPGRRHGRAPRYSIDTERIRTLLDAHLRYLTDQ